MEDLKKLKVKNWKEIAKDRRTWRDLAEKSKNSQRVIVPSDDDDDFIYVQLMVCYINTIIFLTI
jgi:hypothetical protein